MIGYIMFVCISWLCSCYIINKQYANSIASGTINTYYSQGLAVTGTVTTRYKVVFNIVFDNPPSLFLVLNTIQNCPTQSYMGFCPYYFQSGTTIVTTTTFLISGEYYFSVNDDKYRTFKMSYFAVDTVKIPTIYLQKARYLLDASNLGANFTVPLDIDSSTIVRCSIATARIPINNNPYYEQCTLSYPATKIVNVGVGISTPPPTSSYFYTYLSVLVIYPDQYFKVNQGYLQAQGTSKPWGTIPVDLTEMESYYLMGWNYYSTFNQCVLIRPDSSLKQIDPVSNLVAITYFYIQLVFKSFVVNVLPFANTINFVLSGFDSYSLKSGSVTLSNTLALNNFSSSTLFFNMTAPVTSTDVSVICNITQGSSEYKIDFSLKVVTVALITISVFQNKVELRFQNIVQTVSLDNFNFSDTRLTENSLDSNKYLTLDYDKSMVGNAFTVTYTSTDWNNVSSVQLIIPKITNIQTSVLSISSFVLISNILSLDPTKLGTVMWTSGYVKNSSLTLTQGNTLVQANFGYTQSIFTTDIALTYKPYGSSLSTFAVYFNLRIATIKSIQYVVNSSICKLVYTNINNPSSAVLSQFSFDVSDIKILSLQVIDNNSIQLQIDYQGNDTFSLIYDSNLYSYTATTTDLKISGRFVSFSFDIFSHWINFTFENSEGFQGIPEIELSLDSILFNTTVPDGDLFIICTKFKTDIDGSWVSIYYDVDPSTIYQEIITLQLISSSPIVYCEDEFTFKSEVYSVMCYIILVLYWSLFIFSMFFCQKIYAVEMLFILQFAYMTLIPIGVSCPPFKSLSLLRYSFGWNGISFPVSQTFINASYFSLGIQSNTLSNINFMILPMFVCPVIYAIMTALGKASTHYKTKPRLLTYGKTFLLDVLFTLLLINIPNISLSFVVSLQSFGISNIASFITSVFLTLLVVVGGILFIIFRTKFREFKSEFNIREGIWTISVKTSKTLRRFYPLIMFLEMISVSVVLSMDILFGISLYICLGILCLTTLLTMFLTPYKDNLGNIRLFIYRFLIIVICCVQIGFKSLNIKITNSSSPIYDYPLILLIILLLIPVMLFGPYIIYKSVLWVKSKGLIDLDLYNKKQNKKAIISYPNKPAHDGSYYPASEFSRNIKIKQTGNNLSR